MASAFCDQPQTTLPNSPSDPCPQWTASHVPLLFPDELDQMGRVSALIFHLERRIQLLACRPAQVWLIVKDVRAGAGPLHLSWTHMHFFLFCLLYKFDEVVGYFVGIFFF